MDHEQLAIDTLDQSILEIKNLVGEPAEGSSISQKNTALPDGSTISLFYSPERDLVGVAEMKGSPDNRKLRDRKWSITSPYLEASQERHVLRRDRRGVMDLRKYGFRERDVKRIGKLITQFKDNQKSGE